MAKKWRLGITLASIIVLMACKNVNRPEQSTSTGNSIIKVGLIYSNKGDKKITEKSMRDAAAMAIEEINNDGGLLGKQLELVALDSESKDNLYKSSIVQLLNKYQVKAIFCNLPGSMKDYMNAKSKKKECLTFNLDDYINPTDSDNIVMLGSSPYQLLYPGADFLLRPEKQPFTNFFLIGTPDAYSVNANRLLKRYLQAKGVKPENIKEGQIDASTDEASDLFMTIKGLTTKGRTCILNTMSGEANLTFFKEYANQGLSALACPIMSFRISEDEMRVMEAEFNIGHYFCRNYFQSLDTDKNIRFVSNFKLYSAINELPGGIDRVTGESIARTYTAINLWRRAVEKAGSFDKEKTRRSLAALQFDSPAGIVRMSKTGALLDKPAIIAESNIEGQMTVHWQSNVLLPALKRNVN